MDIKIKIALIGAIAAIAAATIPGLFNGPSSPSASNHVDSGTLNHAARDNNNAGRDQYKADGNINIYGDTAKKPQAHGDDIKAGRDVIKGNNNKIDNSVRNYYGPVKFGAEIPPVKFEKKIIEENTVLDNTDGKKHNLLPKGIFYQSHFQVTFRDKLVADTLFIVFNRMKNLIKGSAMVGSFYAGEFPYLSQTGPEQYQIYVINPPNGIYEVYIIGTEKIAPLEGRIKLYRK